MSMSYDGAMVLPSSYVVVDQDEMTYVEGGSLTLSSAIAIIGGLVAAGYGVINIGKECGIYVYNNGGSRYGVMMATFRIGGAVVFGSLTFLFNLGLDNGWVSAA